MNIDYVYDCIPSVIFAIERANVEDMGGIAVEKDCFYCKRSVFEASTWWENLSLRLRMQIERRIALKEIRKDFFALLVSCMFVSEYP